MKPSPSVTVIGAGLAGLSAAIHLAKRGLKVTVIESDEGRLGGRASSISTPDGERIDIGLHVFCRHYLNLLSAMSEAGIPDDALDWFHETGYVSSDRKFRVSALDPLPSPFHLTRYLLSSQYPLRNRLKGAIAGVMVALRDNDEMAREDGRTYEQWNNSNGLGPEMLAFGNAGCDASTFLAASQVSAKPVLSWMRLLLRDSQAADIGVLRGNLAETLIGPLVSLAQRRGVKILTGVPAVGIQVSGHRVVGLEVSGMDGGHRTLVSDYYVSALPVEALQRLSGISSLDTEYFERIKSLQTVPAICVMAWFDRPISGLERGPVLVESGIIRDFKEVARQTRSGGTSSLPAVQFLLSSSAPQSQDDERLAVATLREFAEIWPSARMAVPRKTLVLRIPHAMYAAFPGTEARRPPQRTPLDNLFVAGDWTKHEMNACMEGAFVSGMLAADEILRTEGMKSLRIRRVSDAPLLRISRNLFGLLFRR